MNEEADEPVVIQELTNGYILVALLQIDNVRWQNGSLL